MLVGRRRREDGQSCVQFSCSSVITLLSPEIPTTPLIAGLTPNNVCLPKQNISPEEKYLSEKEEVFQFNNTLKKQTFQILLSYCQVNVQLSNVSSDVYSSHEVCREDE